MKTKSIVIALVALAAGYVAGSFIGFPTTSGNGSGNISKVSKYNKVKISPAMSAFQEKIKNDSVEMSKAAVSLTLLTSRMEEFTLLVDMAVDATAGIAELELPVARLVDIRHTSRNAAEAGRNAIQSFNDLISDKPGQMASQYEQNSQNLSLAYLMTDRQIRYGKEFVIAVDQYLEGRNIDEFQDLAFTRDLWAKYCSGSAIINNDRLEQEYWTSKNYLLDASTMAKSVVETESSLKEYWKVDQILSITINSGFIKTKEYNTDGGFYNETKIVQENVIGYLEEDKKFSVDINDKNITTLEFGGGNTVLQGKNNPELQNIGAEELQQVGIKELNQVGAEELQQVGLDVNSLNQFELTVKDGLGNIFSEAANLGNFEGTTTVLSNDFSIGDVLELGVQELSNFKGFSETINSFTESSLGIKIEETTLGQHDKESNLNNGFEQSSLDNGLRIENTGL